MKNLVIIAIATFLGMSHAQANLALRGKDFSPQAANRSISAKRDDLNLKNRKFLRSNGKIAHLTRYDVAKVIPTNMGATNNQKLVEERIVDRTIKSIIGSKYIQNTKLAQSYKKVKDRTKLGVTVKSAPQAHSTEPPVEHKFDVNIQAMESNATLSYKGYFDTTVNYSMNENKLAIALSERVGKSSTINFTHDENPQGSIQWVRFKTRW